MTAEGHIPVRWIGGPYDGAGVELPAAYLGAACVDMPDPATAYNADPSSEPAIFTGPMHRYRLTRDAEGLVATHVA